MLIPPTTQVERFFQYRVKEEEPGGNRQPLFFLGTPLFLFFLFLIVGYFVCCWRRIHDERTAPSLSRGTQSSFFGEMECLRGGSFVCA